LDLGIARTVCGATTIVEAQPSLKRIVARGWRPL